MIAVRLRDKTIAELEKAAQREQRTLAGQAADFIEAALADRGGRPRLKPIATGEKTVISVRVTPEMRATLESAVLTSGRSLTQEAEHRLELSFFIERLADPVAEMVAQRLLEEHRYDHGEQPAPANKLIDPEPDSSITGATYTVDDAAKLLRLGRNAVYEGVRSGEIPSVRIGRRILIPKVKLHALLRAEKS